MPKIVRVENTGKFCAYPDVIPRGLDVKVTFEWEDPPKFDWGPEDVAEYWDNRVEYHPETRVKRACQATAKLECEAIVRMLKREINHVPRDAVRGMGYAIDFIEARTDPRDYRRLDQ